MASKNNASFIHGNWNPVRSSSSNLYLKGGRQSKKVSSSHCVSHEYPIVPAHSAAFYRGSPPNYCNIDETFDDFKLLNNNNGAFLGPRNAFQYRSNPQISFSNIPDNTPSPSADDFDTLSTTYDKSSCNPVRLAVSRNSNRNRRACEPLNGNSSSSGQQQIQKWKNELTAAASVLPRKWCDFVFRRNEDNRVYRSESFRFIQKTNSLALLRPVKPGPQRQKTKRVSHEISVSDDYVDPVDHLLTSSVPQHNNESVLGAWPTSSTSVNTSSGSRRSELTSSEEGTNTSANLCGEEEGDGTDKDEPPYHEITERYNAPYYYSDTIKEPTYINPCEEEGVRSPGCSSLSNASSSPSPVLSDSVDPVIVTIITQDIDELGGKVEDKITHHRLTGARKQNKLNRRSAYLRGSSRELMARKRYETAFLPSSSPHASSQNTPDIDSLYLAVESSCHLGHGYVTKTDISQPKTTVHSCPQESDERSGQQPLKDALPGDKCNEKQVHGGAGQRVIYISQSNNGASEEGESTNVQQPLSSNPVPPKCMSDAVLITSNDLLPHIRESYHRPSVIEASEISGSNVSLQTNPSTSYYQSHHFHHHYHPHHLHQNLNINLVQSRTSGLCTTTNSSPLASHKISSKPVMPLSEPLPQKRYITKSNSSSGHTTTSSASSTGNGETRRLGHNLKDNSVSSLESIDSTKSEELSSSLNRNTSHFPGSHHSSHYQPQKLLSPISDKSPLEPGTVLPNSQPSEFDTSAQSSQNKEKWSNTMSLIDAAELTNVPWEMPKLRRKLAKFADSGISLDFAGSGSKETECVTAANMASGRASSGGANLETSRGGHPTVSQGGMKKEGTTTSLQLSFDDGLTRDEYYEDPSLAYHEGEMATVYGAPRLGFLTASKIPGSAIVEDVTAAQVHVSSQPQGKHPGRPDRCHMKLDFGFAGGSGFRGGLLLPNPSSVIDPVIDLERQDWFHGAITRSEAENILRATKEGSFLVRNCESTTFNRYSLSLKSFRGCIHIRIEPNSLGTFSLGDQEFPSVPHLVLHFMSHRLPIKGAEHVRLMYPVITQLL